MFMLMLKISCIVLLNMILIYIDVDIVVGLEVQF